MADEKSVGDANDAARVLKEKSPTDAFTAGRAELQEQYPLENDPVARKTLEGLSALEAKATERGEILESDSAERDAAVKKLNDLDRGGTQDQLSGKFEDGRTPRTARARVVDQVVELDQDNDPSLREARDGERATAWTVRVRSDDGTEYDFATHQNKESAIEDIEAITAGVEQPEVVREELATLDRRELLQDVLDRRAALQADVDLQADSMAKAADRIRHEP